MTTSSLLTRCQRQTLTRFLGLKTCLLEYRVDKNSPKIGHCSCLSADSLAGYITINTHKGLFRYNRLPFGVSSAPAIFQRAIETLLKDIPGTVVYIDDILVTGKDDEDHLKKLDAVGWRLRVSR